MALLPRFFALLALCAPAAGFAQDAPAPIYQAAPSSSPDLVFTLRGGAKVTPDYFGSGDYSIGPDAGFSLNFARLPGGLSIGSTDPNDPRYGIGMRGSFRYISKRDTSDHVELSGLNDVDASVELGLGVAYTSRNFDAFADVRYGVVGHESFVGELGADVKIHPTDRLTLSMGPRLFMGTDTYAQTYFGVSLAEAAGPGGYAGGAFNAGGGLLSAGIELGAAYKINDDWGVEGAITWDRLTNDAADSPIVRAGERDQYGIRIGLTRRITLDF
ncbi:MipA/OmpV family protein [Oceaniglobus ichthyenteri]|uniref:MipA/OmpV family protein n=1 Tax=Oceaniglobus ichthyenteri TaxID=2136177 RepID=UPI000D35567C|nr:MipA/OmpV family protein [Oceaniglobus ichthyenteri]